MNYICRCGGILDVGDTQGSIELMSIRGNAVVYLCDACLEQAIAFTRNEDTVAVYPRIMMVMVPDDDDYDDLSQPIEPTEDWRRDVRRPA